MLLLIPLFRDAEISPATTKEAGGLRLCRSFEGVTAGKLRSRLYANHANPSSGQPVRDLREQRLQGLDFDVT